MVLIEDVGNFLTVRNIGILDMVGTTGDISIVGLPTAPDNCIAIFDTGGQGSQLLNDHQRSVQVIVRDVDVRAANARAWSIYNALRGTRKLGGRSVIIKPTDVPRSIGTDNNTRHEFTINFEMWTTGD